LTRAENFSTTLERTMKNPYGILCLGLFGLLIVGTPGFAWQQKEDKCLKSDCLSGWTPIDTPYGGRNIRALAVRSPFLMIAANDSGIYRTNFTSLYGPFSWLLLSKMKVTSVAISIDSITRDTVVYVGTLGNGLLEMQMYPSTLRSPANGSSGISWSSLLFVWPASMGQAPYTLQVSGDSLFNTLVYGPSVNTNSYLANYSWAMVPLTTYYWRVTGYAGGVSPAWSPVWSFTTACSTCTGFSLHCLQEGVSVFGTGLVDKYVRAVTQSSQGVLYAVSSPAVDTGYHVVCSHDGGTSWTGMGMPVAVPQVSLLSVAVDFQGRVFAGTDNGLFIYRSNFWDTIATSTVGSSQLPNKHINALATDNQGRLFAGTNRGAYFSTDSGLNWNVVGGPGLPSRITALAAGSPGAMTPLVGTDSGLFEYAASTSDNQSVQHFSPHFVQGNFLHFGISGKRQLVDIRVYDARGIEVKRVFHGDLPAGSHDVQIDNRGLPSGVYHVRLKIGADTQTAVMVITR
jgi:hypothetical protein